MAGSEGMYDPRFEHDSCGIAVIAHLKGKPSHSIVAQALTALERLDHRGGSSADNQLGDGAGILTQIPHRLFRTEWENAGAPVLKKGMYGVGMFFLPKTEDQRELCETIIHKAIADANLELAAWREVPRTRVNLHQLAVDSEPDIRQVFVKSPYDLPGDIRFERDLYKVRKKIENAMKDAHIEPHYVVSFSSRTLIYKGLLLPSQLRDYFADLKNETYESAMAMVHNRFSTNTFPSWDRAQPYRYAMHNGEINTINGNVNWMESREAEFRDLLGEEAAELLPIIDRDGSDSAMFDNALEFLVLSGWSLPKAMLMLMPEAWEKNCRMDDRLKAFYQYHSLFMEPWDGPAAMAFTDGNVVGARLDRNGLRPARLIVSEDSVVCLSSEVGVVDFPDDRVLCKKRLMPGQMVLVDMESGALYEDGEIKEMIASENDYKKLADNLLVPLGDLEDVTALRTVRSESEVLLKQAVFGYTDEEWEKVLKPMFRTGSEPVASMGYDAPLAVLSDAPQLLFNYFKQRFAQVTNPPIDAIREERVTSMEVLLGSSGNLLCPEELDRKNILLETPILSPAGFRKISALKTPDWSSADYSMAFPLSERMEDALEGLLKGVELAVARGDNLIILTDRDAGEGFAAIPSLLAVSAVHHHLIRKGLRNKTSLIVDSGEPREVHHFAALLGYGANAICPYLVFESLPTAEEAISEELAITNYVKSITKGILKVMSKMGISTVRSYMGAQIFEAIGISDAVISCYFPNTPSKLGGLTIDDLEREVRHRHAQTLEKNAPHLESGSDFQWRAGGETHLFQPKTIHLLQQAVRSGKYEVYREYSRLLAEELSMKTTLRGLMDIKPSGAPVPIEEVEPVESIFKRFKTGAMSYGSISKEAHEAIAVAMNRIGGRSNSGEGGEDPERFVPLANGDSKCSKMKQVASGRFGVTSHYLVNSEEIQIKMAQGAKPGEGGQLAGHKVTIEVAKTRGATPGIELISPPPHHDIYSIEDLAQLIHDLKNANPKARISVKLVSGTGVGTIAAGVAKAKADVIMISGFDGGTGAAARSSIKHAGMPWEIGLSETHQTLKLNGLREKVTLETDGKMMSGRDVVIAALLGAEEYGFSTMPLVSLGCVMMRVCHLDTCPVGIATQNPQLRKNMLGTADDIVRLMHFFAEEVREYMALLGFRTMEEMIGRTDLLTQAGTGHWKAKKLDLSPIFHYQPDVRQLKVEQDHRIDQTLDSTELLPVIHQHMEEGKPIRVERTIRNINRSVGTCAGSELTRKTGGKGLGDDTMQLHFRGSAGQSFGAFVPKGMTLTLEGEANDYVGKGLSGGKIAIYPPTASKFQAEQNVIIGNAAFYGATSGEAYIRGIAGERFCVRNSGAHVVVEGTGNHGCEYMTGGTAIILGEVGDNFAAGMSGGIAYILTEDSEDFGNRCNHELVTLEQLRDGEEIKFLKRQIGRHARYTDSPVAKSILDDWNRYIPQFVRVIPTEYKRILESPRQSEELQYSLN